jgi:hypothetical protein
MDLASLVKKYLDLAGGFGRPVHLSEFGLSKKETEQLISACDEDYQISRYMVLSRERDVALATYPAEVRLYMINDFEVSHVSFDAGIEKLL